MTKSVSGKVSRCNAYHAEQTCENLKKNVKEATDSDIEWHDLTPCVRCYND